MTQRRCKPANPPNQHGFVLNISMHSISAGRPMSHAVSSRAQRVWGPTQVGYAESRDLLLLFVLYQGTSSLMPQTAPNVSGLQPLSARGLVARPEDWKWSSFLHYPTGIEGPVEIESEGTARIREANKMLASGPLCNPPFAKHAKDGAPTVLDQGENVET